MVSIVGSKHRVYYKVYYLGGGADLPGDLLPPQPHGVELDDIGGYLGRGAFSQRAHVVDRTERPGGGREMEVRWVRVWGVWR